MARSGVWSQFLRDQRAKLARRLLRRDVQPWMKTRELDIILEALSRHQPRQCLEWGAGVSTLYFPPRLPSVQSWVSLEHDAAWYATVRQRLADPRVTLRHVPPEQSDFAARSREGTLHDFRSYVEYPRSLGRSFDFIFIDGRARVACLKEAFHLVTETGLVILHDANRPWYLEDLPPFASVELFTDYRKGRGGVLLASRGREVGNVLDLAAHRRLWRGHDRLAKWLMMR